MREFRYGVCLIPYKEIRKKEEEEGDEQIMNVVSWDNIHDLWEIKKQEERNIIIDVILFFFLYIFFLILDKIVWPFRYALGRRLDIKINNLMNEFCKWVYTDNCFIMKNYLITQTFLQYLLFLPIVWNDNILSVCLIIS